MDGLLSATKSINVYQFYAYAMHTYTNFFVVDSLQHHETQLQLQLRFGTPPVVLW